MAETLTVAELAALLGVSKVAVQGRIKRGTLVAEKVGGRYQIAKSEVERLVPGFAEKVGDNVADEDHRPTATGEVGEHGTPVDLSDADVGDKVGSNVNDKVGSDVSDNVGALEDLQRLRDELAFVKCDHETADQVWRQKLAALDSENEMLRVDADSGEREHESTRRELGAVRENLQDARGEVEHLRALSTSQSASINALTNEVQGLTAMVHTRRMLDVPPVEEPKPSALKRWFGRGRKRQVRIGHA